MSAVSGPTRQRFVIVGGYGHVGRPLAELLVPHHDVVVAGRRADAAASAAAALGCAAAAVDAHTGAGLDAVVGPGDVVVNASLDQPDATLLRVATELGGDYADLSADAPSIAAMLGRHDEVRARGRRALVGVGLSPGATNVMARAALDARPGATRLDTVVVLSLLDDFGPAAVEWTLRSLVAPELTDGRGRPMVVRPLGRRRTLDVPGIGEVLAHEFPFPEQYFLPDTLGVGDSTSWCAFHPRSAGRALGAIARQPPVRRLLTRPAVTDRLTRLSRHLPTPRTPGVVGAAGIAADAHGETIVSLASRSESRTTASCAVALLEHWPAGEQAAGVHLPETLIEPGPLLHRLAAVGMRIETASHDRWPASR